MMNKIVDISGTESDQFISAADVEISRKGRQRSAQSSTTKTEEGEISSHNSSKRRLETDVEPDSSEAVPSEEKKSRSALPRGNPLMQPNVLIQAILATSKLNPKPQVLHATGKITMFLDFNNNMQHLNLRLSENVEPVE
jgi:hypothetical protein